MTREDQLLNRSEIIRMSREAGVWWAEGLGGMPEFLERFAALVSKQERWRGFNEGYKQAIKDCVALLMIQHEAANGAHNYWKVAANLIQADLTSDT